MNWGWQASLVGLGLVVALFCLAVSCKGQKLKTKTRINPMFMRDWK